MQSLSGFLTCVLYFACLSSLFAGKSWEHLNPEDQIDIVWPSAKPDPAISFETFSSHLHEIVRSYELGGVRAHPETLDPQNSLGQYYANTSTNRAHFFEEISHSSHTKALWVGRGGFGADEVVELLGKKDFQLPSLPLIGFSDATYLHLLAHTQKRPSLHGPMAWGSKDIFPTTQSPINQETPLKPLMTILKGEDQEVSYTLHVLNAHDIFNDTTEIRTPHSTKVVGGNFSVIQRSIGTPTALQAARSVLFLEDTTEAFNRLKSLLTNTRRAHLFDQVEAVFFGDLPTNSLPLENILKDTPLWSEIPLLQAPGFGHDKLNQVLPLGTKSTLTFTQDGKAELKISTNQSAYDE